MTILGILSDKTFQIDLGCTKFPGGVGTIAVVLKKIRADRVIIGDFSEP